MALAFVNQQPFVTSNIIGATSLSQLSENIESINVELSSTQTEIEKNSSRNSRSFYLISPFLFCNSIIGTVFVNICENEKIYVFTYQIINAVNISY